MSKITRRRLLSGSAVAALLASSRVEARIWGGQAAIAPPPPTGALTTHDLVNVGGSSATNKPYQFTQGFRMGDMPSGSFPLIADNSGNALPTQIEEISPRYPDGSMRHCVLATVPPTTASGAATRLQIKATNSYTPATPRSASEITAGHAFKIKFQEVVDHTFATVGSGNFTFDVNAAIAAGAGVGYEIYWNGAVCMGVEVFGKFTDDAGGTRGDLYCRWYFELYTDPANSANVLYIEHMPFVCQPFMDVSGLDIMIGRMIVMDGATTLRDFGAESFSIGPSDVHGVGGASPSITISGASWAINDNEGFVVTLQAGAGNALPGGIVSGQHIWLIVQAAGISNGVLSPDPRGIVNSSVTTAGTAGGGTPTPFIFSSRTIVNNYQGNFYPSNNFGTPYRTGSAWADFEMCLDKFNGGVAQRNYWQNTGLVPGWSLSLGSTLLKMDFAAFIGVSGSTDFESPLHRPGTHGMYRPDVGAGSTAYDYGPMCEWDARFFMRQGVSNWARTENQFERCCALTAASMPFTQLWRSAVPRHPVVNNNGPHQLTTPPFTSGSGGTYPGLGASNPNVFWVNNTAQAGISIPAGAANSWPLAPWNASALLDSSHWPVTGWFQYAMFGKRYFRDTMDAQAEHNMISGTGDGSDGSLSIRHGTWTPPTPGIPNCAAGYTFYSHTAMSGEERDDMAILPIVAASVLGDANRPEMAWWRDWVNSSVYLLWDYFWNSLMNQGHNDTSPGIKTTGWWTWARIAAAPWMMMGYGAVAYGIARNMTRHTLGHVPVEAMATLSTVLWDGTAGIPQYFISGYYTFVKNAGFLPLAPPGNAGRGTSPYPKSTEIFGGYDGFSLDTTGLFTRIASSGGIGSSNSPRDQVGGNPMANDDEVIVGWNFMGTFDTTYTGPAQYDPNTRYYVCQMNTNGANTFRLSTTAGGGSPITTSTAFAAISLAVRYHSYNPAPGTGTGFLMQTQNQVANNSYAMCLGACREIDRGGAPTLPNTALNWAAALVNQQAWYLVDNTVSLSPTDSGARYFIVGTNAVV